MGYYEVLGDDDVYYDLGYTYPAIGYTEILGAAPGRPMIPGRPSMPMRPGQPRGSVAVSRGGMPIAPFQPAASALVSQDNLTKPRRKPLGFQTSAAGTTTAAGTAVNFNVQPPYPFRAEKIACNPLFAPDWEFNTLLIGTDNQIVNGPITATVFAALNPETAVAFETAQTAQVIQMTLTNVSLAPSRLAGCFYGTLLQP